MGMELYSRIRVVVESEAQFPLPSGRRAPAILIMYRRYLPGLWLSVFLTGALLGPLGAATAPELAPAIPPVVRRAWDAVSAEDMREHVKFLADDRLEGRDTGSAGGLTAARYLADGLKAAGLKPAGDNGTFFQEVPCRKSRMDAAKSRVLLNPGASPVPLEFGRDFLINGMGRYAAAVEGPLVFAGYGITAPEFNHDDYRDLEVKGKVVVLISGEPVSRDPAFFDGDKDTRYAAGDTKIELAKSKGAVGVVTILTGERARRYPWDRMRGFESETQVDLPAAHDGFPALLIRDEAAGRLFHDAPQAWTEVQKQISEGSVRPCELAYRVRIELALDDSPCPGPNVVGLLEGSDPALKNQVVVYSAHYDHLGKGKGEGDVIYNGAWDNASGTAEVLELAHALSRMKPRPRRSILFLFVTGEEHGLLGSLYYVRHPVVPIENTAADINLDMTDIFGIPREFVPLGAERSSLMDACEAVAAQTGLKIGPDPTPEEQVFTRSDQISFARVGVPCIFLRWANEYEDLSAEEAKARMREKMRTIYHRVSDAYDPAWSWEGMRRHAQVALLLGVEIANRRDMPVWKQGDAFDRPRKTPPLAAMN